VASICGALPVEAKGNSALNRPSSLVMRVTAPVEPKRWVTHAVTFYSNALRRRWSKQTGVTQTAVIVASVLALLLLFAIVVALLFATCDSVLGATRRVGLLGDVGGRSAWYGVHCNRSYS